MSRVAVKHALETLIEDPTTAPNTWKVGENRGTIPEGGKTYIAYRVVFGGTRPQGLGWQNGKPSTFQEVILEAKIVAHAGSGTNHVSTIIDSIRNMLVETGSITIDTSNTLQIDGTPQEISVGEDEDGKHIYIVEQAYRWSRR